jgi:hypothetical protein
MVSLSNHELVEPWAASLKRRLDPASLYSTILIVAHGDFEQEALGARLVYELGESARLFASLAPFFGVWFKPAERETASSFGMSTLRAPVRKFRHFSLAVLNSPTRS